MPFQTLLPDLFLWSDTCNVYVLRDGDAALLIDLGDGGVLDHLAEIGVRRVEWVLFTHHHREQCQGAPRLADWKPQVAAPDAERAFFERPADFRRMNPALDDPFSVYGASFVRPPVRPLPLDHTFRKMDDFVWRGREIWCIETAGNSPGSMSYLLRHGDGWLAFAGDVMLDGAKLHTWFDSEWDYGFGRGIHALHNSAALLESFQPSLLLASHGPVVRDPVPQLREYRTKLRTLEKRLLRGYEVSTFAGADQDCVSKPTRVPHVWQVSTHLFKFKGPDYWPNFHMLLADSGHALVVDCGLFDRAFLDAALQRMRERLGLKQIDAVIVTHYHGDHCQEAPHLREKWGAQVWTLDRVAERCRSPFSFDYAASINAYGRGVRSISFDRVLRDGETFRWEGYALTADWMPGQTEFACCLHGTVDGRRVAFTGDNIFGNASDLAQTGLEAVVARNSGILEEGYLYAADYLHGLQPDLILGGHSWVIEHPGSLIERYRRAARALRTAFRSLSPEPDYRPIFDPYWIRAEPYRLTLGPGQSRDAVLSVRNFTRIPQPYRIAVNAPHGIRVTPGVLEGVVPAGTTERLPLSLAVQPAVPAGVRIVAFDVTFGEQRRGEWFDMIVMQTPCRC